MPNEQSCQMRLAITVFPSLGFFSFPHRISKALGGISLALLQAHSETITSTLFIVKDTTISHTPTNPTSNEKKTRLNPSLLVLRRLGLALLLLVLLAIDGLVGGDKVLLALALLLFFLGLLLLEALLLGHALLGVAADVVLASLELEVDLAGLGGGREGRVGLLLADLVRLEALAQAALLVVGEEAVPGLVLQGWVLGELALHHELLDLVYGVDVLHRVLDHPAHFFQALVAPDGGDCAALDLQIC